MRITSLLLIATLADAAPWDWSKNAVETARREDRILVYAASSDWA